MIDRMASPLDGPVSIFALTCRLVVCVIPLLVRHGLIDRQGSVFLGALIGTAVALCSMSRDSVANHVSRPTPSD